MSRALYFFERLLPYRVPVVWTIHAVQVTLAYLLAFYVSGDLFPGGRQWSLVIKTLPLLLLVRMGTFAWFHLFEGLWRYVSMRDMCCRSVLCLDGRDVPVVIQLCATQDGVEVWGKRSSV